MRNDGRDGTNEQVFIASSARIERRAENGTPPAVLPGSTPSASPP